MNATKSMSSMTSMRALICEIYDVHEICDFHVIHVLLGVLRLLLGILLVVLGGVLPGGTLRRGTTGGYSWGVLLGVTSLCCIEHGRMGCAQPPRLPGTNQFTLF